MKTEEILDACMEKLGVNTDYKLAKATGIHSWLISLYRRGERIPSPYACFKFAEILGIDERKLIIEFELEFEKNDKKKEFWKKQYEQLGGIAASILLAVTLIVTPTPSKAAPVLSFNSPTLYIMLNRLFAAILKKIWASVAHKTNTYALHYDYAY